MRILFGGDMKQGLIEAYYGKGKGKTSLAMGQSLKACAQKKRVIIIQFLKGKEKGEYQFLEGGQIDIKFICFEKSDLYYEDLPPAEQEEQAANIRNGLHFARKVIATHECDLLVLDEILGLPDYAIASCEEINDILKVRNHGMHIILTGQTFPKDLSRYVDVATRLDTEYLHES